MAHHIDNTGIYADTAFVNAAKKIPGVSVESMGFGEFVLKTPKGDIDVDRMRGKDFPGQSGRSHKLYPEDAAKWLVKQMESKGYSDKMASYSYDRTQVAAKVAAKCSGIRDIEEGLRETKKLLQRDLAQYARDPGKSSPQYKICQDMLKDLDKAAAATSEAYKKGILLEGYKR
jgi:hypothetical protein